MRIIVTIILIVLNINIYAQKGKLYISSWHENEDSELTIPSDQYSIDKKGGLLYYISNDNENVYIDMKIEDPVNQNRILKNGLTIWINMDSKLARKLGIRYPIGSLYQAGNKRSNIPVNSLNADGSIVTPLSLANSIELIGFISEEARRFPSDNADNFRGSVKYESDGTLLYHLVMPIAKLPVRNSKDESGAMPFTIGIEYGPSSAIEIAGGAGGNRPSAMTASGGSSRGATGGGRPGGASSGGRMGGAGPRPGPSSTQNKLPPVLIWIKNIKLANKN